MHHEHMAHSLSFAWVSPALSLLFLSGVFFYLFRLFNPSLLRRVNGYYDRENEFWHGACLLGMSACLTPSWLPLPSLVWTVGFAIGTGWYLVRGFTYGRRLTYNKQWFDFAHAGMLFGMWWMFAHPIDHVLIDVAFAAYWLWFGSYYVYRIALDFKKPSVLAFGQDGAHFVMSLVMLIMTVWPAALHDHHGNHHASMESGAQRTVDGGKLVPIDNGGALNEICGPSAASGVTLVTDANFDARVASQTGTVVVLVSGGCINCATEVPVFERVAATLGSRAHFVRLHKDASPNACSWLKATDCPALLIVSGGKVIARLDGFTEHDAMEAFVRSHLAP
ncbi:MAG: thioredoxin domain-containing protein [Candidatus Melainabacteria bacterium]|nr:thioredoxin domain-containing protein [Candidatus Melainabacteria bacterium]